MTCVAQIRCRSYSEDVESAIRKALDALGGIKRFVRSGQKVLLKPNMLSARHPEQAVTTHPQVVRAMIRLTRACGASPMVGDSPANVMKIEEVWNRTGIGAVCTEEGVPLLNLESCGAQQFKKNGFSFAIATPLLKADVVINLPKVKTHVLTIFTGAVKNMYGSIPGFQKTTLHKEFPTPSRFGELLAEVYGAVRPHLNVADGIVGMEGDGPSGGKPVALGFVMASVDGVALDVALCNLLGIRLDAVPYLAPLRARHLGETDPQKIELRGAPKEELRPPRFRVPGTLRGRLIPPFLARSLGRYLWIRPVFTDKCMACGGCVKACPAEAIEPTGRPFLVAKKCIGCCCCHEVCPASAVEMRMSTLLSVLRRGRLP